MPQYGPAAVEGTARSAWDGPCWLRLFGGGLTHYRMKAALLPDRGVVKLAGDGARNFLHGLVTADILKLAPGAARFCALLTPQGKIIADFIVVERARRKAAAKRANFTAASFSIFRARSARRWSRISTSTNCAPRF